MNRIRPWKKHGAGVIVSGTKQIKRVGWLTPNCLRLRVDAGAADQADGIVWQFERDERPEDSFPPHPPAQRGHLLPTRAGRRQSRGRFSIRLGGETGLG